VSGTASKGVRYRLTITNVEGTIMNEQIKEGKEHEMAFKTIKFEEPETEVSLITLDRPERLNALSLDMVEELQILFGQLYSREQVRVLMITGEGRGFCSGADLKDARLSREAATFITNATIHLVTIQKKYANLVPEMRRLPQPIIAVVNGPAAGGGMCRVPVKVPMNLTRCSRQGRTISPPPSPSSL